MTGIESYAVLMALCTPLTLFCGFQARRAQKARTEAQIETERRRLQKRYFDGPFLNSDKYRPRRTHR